MISENILSEIGNTPLVYLSELNKNLSAKIAVKIESNNPSGSVKDRAALNMIEQAEIEGKINSNTHIIEPTSGNTGIALAMICAVSEYKLTIVMPENVSLERRQIIKAYGANLILTDKVEGMIGAINKAESIAENQENSFIPYQFKNKNNSLAHVNTANEIWEQSEKKVDIFVAAAGTGGTFSGTSKTLKEKNSKIKTYIVEPENSAVLSGKEKGVHTIQGIGAGFIPEILDKSLIDEIITVSDKEAFQTAKQITKTEGIFCGISAGANVFAATKLAKRPENKGKLIITIIPDSGERYLSVDNFI